MSNREIRKNTKSTTSNRNVEFWPRWDAKGMSYSCTVWKKCWRLSSNRTSILRGRTRLNILYLFYKDHHQDHFSIFLVLTLLFINYRKQTRKAWLALTMKVNKMVKFLQNLFKITLFQSKRKIQFWN